MSTCRSVQRPIPKAITAVKRQSENSDVQGNGLKAGAGDLKTGNTVGKANERKEDKRVAGVGEQVEVEFG